MMAEIGHGQLDAVHGYRSQAGSSKPPYSWMAP
jgi:hypothetical protein